MVLLPFRAALHLALIPLAFCPLLFDQCKVEVPCNGVEILGIFCHFHLAPVQDQNLQLPYRRLSVSYQLPDDFLDLQPDRTHNKGDRRPQNRIETRTTD
jgi:hypothetical protein